MRSSQEYYYTRIISNKNNVNFTRIYTRVIVNVTSVAFFFNLVIYPFMQN